MATTLSKKEIADIFVEYVNDKSLWYDFKSFVEGKGYTLSELEIEDD